MSDKSDKAKRSSQKKKWILVVLSIVSVVGLQLSFLLLFVGMLPSVVCYISDRDPSHSLFKTVAAMNFTGVFYHLMDLLVTHHNSITGLHMKLQDSSVWFMMYLCAALGYALYYLSPHVVVWFMRMTSEGRMMHLEMTQNRLVKDWGEEVAMQPSEVNEL